MYGIGLTRSLNTIKKVIMLNRKNTIYTTSFNEEIKRNLFNYLMNSSGSDANGLWLVEEANTTHWTKNPELDILSSFFRGLPMVNKTASNKLNVNSLGLPRAISTPLLKPTVNLNQIANKDIVLRYSTLTKENKKIGQQVSSYLFNKDNKIMNSLSLFVGTNDLALSEMSMASCVRYSPNKWYLIEDLQKILVTYFKSMYSLISKAKFKVFAEKINVELLYYITIPDANIFTWYMIFNRNETNTTANINRVMKNSVALASPARSNTRKIEYLKRKNKLIKLLINQTKKISRINVKERFFQLNLKSINYLYESKFNSLVRFFNSLFQKPIEFLLIRLHHSDADSNILAQLVLLVLKKKNIRRIINKLFNKKKVKDINKMKFAINSQKLKLQSEASKFIPVFLSGLYIHIGGRLMREPIIPRRTTKKFEKGAIAAGKVNSLEETSITKKNRKGAYTIKIIFAQNIMPA